MVFDEPIEELIQIMLKQQFSRPTSGRTEYMAVKYLGNGVIEFSCEHTDRVPIAVAEIKNELTIVLPSIRLIAMMALSNDTVVLNFELPS